MEVAQEKAAYKKSSITKIKREAEEYLNSISGKTIGKAKNLLKQIESTRIVLDDLQMAGLVANHSTVGITTDELEDFDVQISNTLAQLEYDAKIAEAKARAASNELARGTPHLQLPDLTGFSAWLSFKKAINDIMPLHSNSLIKKQLLLKSLKNREDHSRCLGMSYEDGFKYLVQRYESSALIPGLIDELLRLSPATNARQSYENLTKLVSTTSMIKSYDQIDKLDSNARSKLTFILIPTELQLDFLKDQSLFEEDIKRTYCTDLQDVDALSEASCLQTHEIESKRRDWWLEQMNRYLTMTRELIKYRVDTPNKKGFNHNQKNRNSSYNVNVPSDAASYSISQGNCPCCNVLHKKGDVVLVSLGKCPRFKQMDVKQRISVVESSGYCKRCLRTKSIDHPNPGGCNIAKESNIICNKCNPASKTHHPLLHYDAQPVSQQSSKGKGPNSGNGNNGKGNGGSKQRSRRGKGRNQNSRNQQSTYSTQDSNNTQNDDLEIVTYKTSTDLGIPEDKQIAIQACSYVYMKTPDGSIRQLVALLDIGSTATYILEEIAHMDKLVPVATWSGPMTTLHGTHHESNPIYKITLLDLNNHHHAVYAQGQTRIGMKHSLPQQFFNKLCSAFKMSKNAVQNPGAPMALLIGMDNAKFLASKMITNHPVQFPGIFLWITSLNPLPFFGGGMKSKVQGDFRTISFATTNNNSYTKPCNKAIKDHSKCSLDDVSCKDFLHTPVKKMIAILLLLMNTQLLPIQTSNGSTSSFLVLPMNITCQTKELQHPSLNYMKMSPALASVEDSSGVSNLACSQCSKAMANCRRCAYINSSLSIKDLEELEILSRCISVIDTVDGKKIMVSYPLKENALEYFSAKNTNREAARINTIRLRERLVKNNLLDSYHEEMEKSLERGHISFFDDYHKNTSPQLFIFQNFMLKESSSSHACRPVSNSGTKNRSGHDLNSMTLAGPNFMCNGAAVFLSFRLLPVGIILDISRCFRSLVTDEQTNLLRLFYWYRKKDDPNSLAIMRYERVTYGDRPAQCLLEISFRTIVSPECKLEVSKSIIANSRIVDDCCGSLQSQDEADHTIADITQAFGKFSFSIKHAFKTGDDVDPQGVLGMLWSPKSDLLSVTTVLNIHSKRRGKSSGLPLNAENIANAVLDKTRLARLAGQCFELLNCLIGPVQSVIRIVFSLASSHLKDWVTPLHLVDKDLDTQFRTILLNLVDLPSKIKPMSRNIVPAGYTLKRIGICSDSGAHGLACTVYFISSNKNDDIFSTLTYTKPKVHKMSTPDSEFCAVVVAVKTLAELLSFDSTIRITKNKPIQILIATDSMCTLNSLSPTKIHKEVRPRNYSHLVYRLSTEMCNKFPNITIIFTHLRSAKNSADLLTKLVPDPTILANLKLYRVGPDEFSDLSWPQKKRISLKFCHDQEPIYQKPIAEQDDDVQEGVQCMRCCSEDYCLSSTSSESPPTTSSTTNTTYNHIGILSEEHYKSLITNCRSLVKAVNVVIRLISLFSPSFKNMQTTDQATVGFLTLVKSHQQYYQPTRVKQTQPTMDCYNIARISTRMSPDDGSSLGIHHAPVLISHHDHRLVWLLINHSHLAISGVKAPIHLGPTFTLAKLRSGQYAAHITRARQYVDLHITKCVVCRFAHARPSSAQLGSPRFIRHLHNNNIVFAIASLDPVGPYLKKSHKNSRTSVKFYLLLITCCVSKACNIVILEGLTREDIIMGLRQHSNQYRTPAELYLDAGTSVNPHPGSDLWNKYFNGEDCKVHQLASSHQLCNFVERTVAILKRLLRTSFLQRDSLHLPHLTFSELSSLISTVINLLNSRPIFSTTSGSQVITPNHLLKTHMFHQSTEDEAESAMNSLQLNFQHFYSQLKITHSVFVNIVKNAFKSNLGTTHYLGSDQKAVFLNGDFVLIFRTQRLGVGLIVNPGPQFCEVKSAETSPPSIVNIHCNKLLLLYRDQPENSRPDSYPLMDNRDGSNSSTSCFARSFLIIPSNRLLKQRLAQ